MSSKKEYIEIKGAREHNLKGIDLKIPRNELVVLTGLSGSGKSSLAFDTIFYFEGQRRVHGIFIVICAPVPRTDGKAECEEVLQGFRRQFRLTKSLQTEIPVPLSEQ